ncbi:MAG: hypothetical protein JSW62_04355 [Thermoplasmatales archaeon]|nr:MAG: hypothetical protein JSW62_04355 [Thermoplasmatales archaeon]
MKGFAVAIISIIIMFSILFSVNVTAGSRAGVGVLNVKPEYNEVRVVQQDNTIRIYLTISDYNSWEDIYKVTVSLEYYDSEEASFTFKQYEDATSYVKINEFSEKYEEKKLLLEEKCTYSHSDKKETVEDRCNLDILLVFRTTWFTQLNIITYDREESTATVNIDYSSEETVRSNNAIMIPGLDGPIPVRISSLILDLTAIFAGLIGVLYYSKKIGIGVKHGGP